MQTRIQKILREEGMTAAKFSEEIGIQASSISHFLSGRNKPSTDILVKILDRFRAINAEWLLTGRGTMYKDDIKTDKSSGDITDNAEEQAEITHNLFSLSDKSDSGNEENNETGKQTVNTADKSFENPENNQNKAKSTKNKTITEIMIFFSDNTFESYYPNK